MEKAKADLALRNLEFVQEELKLHGGLKAKVASPNVVRLDLRTMVLRDYGRPGGIPTLVNAPFAGHRAMIADYHKGQSLVETLLAGGVGHVALTDWKSATDDMKDFDIDNYLEELIVAIDDLGGRVNLVGLCQGGWSSAMVAARFPDKVNALVLAGSPIDTDAGDGPIKRMAHDTPMSAYEDLVRLGGGLMRGQIMLAGWKNMHPEKHYVAEDLDFYQHMDDPAYKERVEVFDSWYEDPLDLPGRWYLQAIRQLFKENRFAKGEFVGLGRRLNLKSIACPALSPRRRERRHHDQRAGFRGGEPRRNPERSDREEAGPRRTHRSLHGLAHAQGDVADDRAVANSFGLRLTLGAWRRAVHG